MDEAVQAGFGEAGGFEELGALGGFELGDFGFHRAADADDFAPSSAARFRRVW